MCGPAVRVSRDNQHALDGAYVPPRLPSLGERRGVFPALEVPLEVGIANVRRGAGIECVGHAQNDEASALGRVEDTVAVAEFAGFLAQVADLQVLEIEYLHRLNRVRYLLPVGADILHRRSADAAGDPAQALDAATLRHHRMPNESVPGFSSAHIEKHLAVVRASAALVNAWDRDFQHQSGPACIGDHHVAAAT